MSLPVTFSDYSRCELVAATNASATTLIVSSPTEPFPTFDVTHTYFYLTLVDQPSYVNNTVPPVQREILKVTAYATVASGVSITCVRGSGGTTGQIWAVGAIGEIRSCSQMLEDLKGGDGSAWAITDGIVTVTDVTSLFVGATGAATVLITDLGSNAAALTIGATGASGGSITVTDGSTTVTDVTTVDFTTGALVTSGGTGIANVAVTGAPFVNVQTGTTYTIQSTDNGKIITFDNTGTISVTVPSGLGGGPTTVFYCECIQLNVGQVVFAGSGATLNSYGSFNKIAGRHGAATLISYVANVFNLAGNISL